jgi:hypothetical protein
MTAVLMVCLSDGVSYPTLGRERRIRSFVPNIASITDIFKPNFEHPVEKVINTLERMFVSRHRDGYSFDCLEFRQPATTDIRATDEEEPWMRRQA